jgi:hypothetical protein
MKSKLSVSVRMPRDSIVKMLDAQDIKAVEYSLENVGIRANIIDTILAKYSIEVIFETAAHIDAIRHRINNAFPGKVITVVEL